MGVGRTTAIIALVLYVWGRRGRWASGKCSDQGWEEYDYGNALIRSGKNTTTGKNRPDQRWKEYIGDGIADYAFAWRRGLFPHVTLWRGMGMPQGAWNWSRSVNWVIRLRFIFLSIGNNIMCYCRSVMRYEWGSWSPSMHSYSDSTQRFFGIRAHIPDPKVFLYHVCAM